MKATHRIISLGAHFQQMEQARFFVDDLFLA